MGRQLGPTTKSSSPGREKGDCPLFPAGELSLSIVWNKETASVSLFSQPKDHAVQNFVLRLLNSHCPGLAAKIDGPRADSRVNLVVVVAIVPIVQKRLQVDEAFTAVTKEFSKVGVGVVLDRPLTLEQALLGFRTDGQMTFLRGQAVHLDAMGGGFYHLGVQLLDVVSTDDYPQLKTISL